MNLYSSLPFCTGRLRCKDVYLACCEIEAQRDFVKDRVGHGIKQCGIHRRATTEYLQGREAEALVKPTDRHERDATNHPESQIILLSSPSSPLKNNHVSSISNLESLLVASCRTTLCTTVRAYKIRKIQHVRPLGCQAVSRNNNDWFLVR